MFKTIYIIFRTLKCHKLSLRRIYISAHEITRKHHLLLFQGQGRILAQGRLFRKLRQAEGNRPRAHLRQPRRKIRARRQGPVQDNRGRRKLRRDRRRRPRPLHARRRLHRLHPDRPPVARQEVEQGRRPQLRHVRLLQVHPRRLQGKSPRAQGRLLPRRNPPRRKREQLRLPLPSQEIRRTVRAALLLESHLEKGELCQQYRAQVQEHPRRDDILERQGAQPAHRRQEDKRHRDAPVHERHHADAPRHVRHPARRKEEQDTPERTPADPVRKNPPVRDQAGRNRARHLRRQRRRGGSRAQFKTELHPHRTRPQEHPQNQGQARRQPLLPGSILESNPGPRQPERIKEGEALLFKLSSNP